jgi:hypothetical protein
VLAAVKAGDLLEVVWVSLVAGVIVCIAFALVVLGGARSAESRRVGRGTAAMAYGALAVLAFAAFGGAVIYGLHVMLAKS